MSSLKHSLCCLRCDIPPDTNLLFDAACRDPASISFGERAPESSGFKVQAVSRRPRLLPPGVVQITTVDRVEAKIVDEAKHYCLGIQRIADDRKSDRPLHSPRNALFEKAFGEDVVEALITGRPICCATHWLSSMPRSIASMRPSRSSGW